MKFRGAAGPGESHRTSSRESLTLNCASLRHVCLAHDSLLSILDHKISNIDAWCRYLVEKKILY